MLTQAINWHWIFFVNLPIGVATALLAAAAAAQRTRASASTQGADVPGALLIVAALMLGVYTIVEAADYGWGSAHTLGFGAVALALLAAFVVREARAANPLVPLRHLPLAQRWPAPTLIQVLMVAGMFGMFFLGALYLQRVLGYDALEVGLAFLPVTVLIGAALARLLGAA